MLLSNVKPGQTESAIIHKGYGKVTSLCKRFNWDEGENNCSVLERKRDKEARGLSTF